MYAAEKSPDKRTTNGGVEVNNASVVNSPDLSPVKNVRNGEAEEAEVRKTKVGLSFKYTAIAVLFQRQLCGNSRKELFFCPEMANR